MEKLQHIVIIGGGFAGLNLAKELDKNKESPFWTKTIFIVFHRFSIK